MANLYASSFGTNSTQSTASGAVTSTSAYFYKGASISRQGQTITRTSTYTGTIANADVLKISGGFVQGERLVSFDCSMSADPDTDNDSVVHIGYTSDPDGILASSTGFQAGADVNVETSGQAVATLTATLGDELIWTQLTGEHEASVTYTFTVVTAL